jgi:YVTN family beta-propeller protein
MSNLIVNGQNIIGGLPIDNSDDNILQFTFINNGDTPKTYTIGGGEVQSISVVEDNEIIFSIIKTLENIVDLSPSALIYDSSTNYVYIGSAGNNIAVLNAVSNSIISVLTTSDGPTELTFVPSINRIFASCIFSDDLVIINTSDASIIEIKNLGSSQPRQSSYCSKNGFLYIPCNASNNVVVFNTSDNSIITTIGVGTFPRYSAYDPVNNYIYVSNFASANVSVIDADSNTVIETISVGSLPVELIYLNGFVYVSSLTTDTVTVINTSTNSVSAIISGFLNPRKLNYLEEPDRIYVCNSASNTLGVINPNTNSFDGSITVGQSPVNLIYNSLDNYVYVANSSSNNVSVFDNTLENLITTIDLSGQISPVNITYNTLNGNVYVINIASNSLSIIDSYEVVTNTLNNGQTIEQFNNQIAKNPISIKNFLIEVTDRDAFNTPLTKKVMNAQGKIESEPVSLLSKVTAYDSNTVNVVGLEGKDFDNAIIDGANFIEHVIPPQSTINVIMQFEEINLRDMLMGKTSEKKKKRKKYSHAKFQFSNLTI